MILVRPAKTRAHPEDSRVAWPAWSLGRRMQLGLAVSIYLATALFATWPVALDLGSNIYLPPTAGWEGGGDLAGSIAHLREFAQGNFPFLPGRVEDFNAPDGLEIRWPLNLANFSSMAVLYILALVFGAHVAYNLFVILGYVASGVAMFLFLRSLTGSAWIGVLLGWAFAFYPFALMKAEHPGFLHGWVFVLVGWRLFALSERPSIRNGLWAGAAGILATSWTHYFILLGGVFYAALVVADLVLGASRRDFRPRVVPHAVGVSLVFGFVLLMRYLLATSSAPGVGAATEFKAIIETSAKPLMYLVPSGNTLLGHWTQPFLADRGLDAVEWSLYLGVTTMLLAAVGLVAALLSRLPARLRRTSLFGIVVVVSGLVFSAPPRVELFGQVITTPTQFVFNAAPAYRLYTRFVIVVMFGVCLLAALGLVALTRQRGGRVTASVLAAASILIPLDLWNRPSNAVQKLDAPPIYDVLRSQPPGTVAEYPIRSLAQVGHYLDLYYQDEHGNPILNGYYRGPYEERALVLKDLGDPTVAGKLRTLGVRYVLVTPRRLAPQAPRVGKPTKGFQFVDRDSYGSLYRVTAKPRPIIVGWKGFAPLEGPRGARYQWVGDAHAQIEVVVDCSPCAGFLIFESASFAQPRLLEIRAPQVGTLRRATVPTNPVVLGVPLRFDRRVVLDLYISPGPQSIAEAIGGNDIRKVTVWIGKIRFVPFR